MGVAILKKIKEQVVVLDWRKKIICNFKVLKHNKNSSSPCWAEFFVKEEDLVLMKCVLTKISYVVTKCSNCGQLIEVCDFDKLPSVIKKLVGGQKLQFDSCKKNIERRKND